MSCEPGAIPRPGEFALARWPDPAHYLRRALFPRSVGPDGFGFEIGLHPGRSHPWTPGMALNLLGPAGSPIRLPDNARRLLLIDGGPGPGRLLPLADLGLRRGMEVALLLSRQDYPVNSLPAEIEIRRGDWKDDLPDALSWADFALADPQAKEESRLLALLHASRRPGSRTPANILLTPSMPCGVGACGACAVQTRAGWRLACVDGPAFDGEALPTWA